MSFTYEELGLKSGDNLSIRGVRAISTRSSVIRFTGEIGFRLRGKGLVLQAYSGGCTSSDNFQVEVDRAPLGQVRAEIQRTRADRCRAHLPFGTPVLFAYETLGLEDPNLRRDLAVDFGEIFFRIP